MPKSTSLQSMTAFANTDLTVGGTTLRLEMRSLNHRYLDLKVRIPRELSLIENEIRSMLQDRFARGAIDFKMDFVSNPDNTNIGFEPNLGVAADYFECINTLQKTLGLKDPITTRDVLYCPDIIKRTTPSSLLPQDSAAQWDLLKPAIDTIATKLIEMRGHEGNEIKKHLSEAIQELQDKTNSLKKLREKTLKEQKTKITDKITNIFQSYWQNFPTAPANIKEVLESRIAQELAMLVDRTDIEEELTRLDGHLKHFLTTLNAGSPNGRKLEFILQEMHREVNTIGSKSQDFGIHEQVIEMKTRIEQIREQTLNIE